MKSLPWWAAPLGMQRLFHLFLPFAPALSLCLFDLGRIVAPDVLRCEDLFCLLKLLDHVFGGIRWFRHGLRHLLFRKQPGLLRLDLRRVELFDSFSCQYAHAFFHAVVAGQEVEVIRGRGQSVAGLAAVVASVYGSAVEGFIAPD